MSLMAIRHIPRPGNDAEDAEIDHMLNSFVEPVPHLEELAQCLRADFVHVENKYGVFQSIPPEIFEHQLFESEELDIGPGTTSSSQQGANGNGVHSQGGELGQKSYGSPIAAFDPLFSWDAECAAVLGQRLPGSPNVTSSSGTRFSVRILACDIQVGLVEPMYGTICLYHLEKKEKLSEDFYFQFLPEDWPGESTPKDMRTVFHVEAQSASVCLLIQMEKPATEDSSAGIKSSVYARKDPKWLSDKEAARLSDWAQMMPFREAFAWTTIPLFDSSVTGGVGGFGHHPSDSSGATTPRSPVSSFADGGSSHSLLSDFGGPPVLVEIPQLNRVKESYTTDELYDPKRKIPKPVRAVMQFEIERLPLEQPGSTQGPPTPSNPYPIFRALDFRSMNCMEPHTKLLHCLFVYPQCIALSKKFNIFIRVELRSDDSDLQKPAMEGIYSREGGPQLLRSAFSQVAPGSKTAMYHDEFKVRMPAVFTPQHHLLFTFFHVELAMRNEPPRPTVVGYAVLPLTVGAQSLRLDVSLPVSKEVLPNYLQDSVKRKMTYWEDGKPVFRVRMRMCSSIYPVSDRVREFFRVYDRHVLHSAPPGPELLDAINKLKEVELPILLQFLYPILNMLLCMIGNGIETLQVAAFRAMINIITNVQKASMESSPRNKYLVHFVDYMFDDLGRQQLPVYPGLCNVWRSLARSKSKGYKVGPVYDDALSMAWFVLELIIKSMDLELAQVPQDDEIPRLHLEDEVYLGIWQLFDCLLSEVQDRARKGHPLTWHLNSSIAFFCYDLLSVVDPPQIFELVGLYLTKFAGVCPPELHRYKLTFLHILADHDFYIETPGRVPAEKNYLTTVLLKELFVSLDHEDLSLQARAAKTLEFLMSKHEHDVKYQQPELKLYIAQLYYPIIGMILDEVTVYRNLSSAEKRNVLVCMLTIMRNLDEDSQRRAWSQSATRTRLFFQLLEESLTLFEYKRPALQGPQTSSTNNPDDELPTSPKYSDKLARSANNFFAEATKNDSKGTLREHLLRKMGVPGVSGSVNARMPLAQAMAQAQVSRTEASKVLRDGLPPVYKQKLDMWESNLAARVSLEVLDVLNTFFEAAAATAAEQQQQGDSASSASAAASSGLSGGGGSGSGVGGAIVAADFDSMDSIAGPLAAFLVRGQSIEFWRRFLPSLARVLETQGRSLLSNSKEKFLRNITFHLMRRLVFKNEAMRKAALVCIHLIVRASLLFYKSARRMKAVLTITLSELISDLKILQRGIMGSFEETAALHRLRSSIRALGSGSANAALLREYAVGPQNSRLLAVLSADTEEGRSQREELRDLEAALLRVLEASREHAQLLEDSKVGDKHVLVESYYGLSQAYAHVPDLHIMWLLHLCTAHQEMFAWAEAAQCTIAVAAIIMKALISRPGAVWRQEHLQAVQRICSVFNEEGRKHNSAPTDMDGFGATTLTVDSAVKYLQMGSNFFKKAEVYQFCAELLELMLPVHKHRRAYGQLSRCHTALTGTYEMILTQQISPVPFKDGAYYRVGFYGSRFKNLDRKEYIYRELRDDRLGDIMEKLGKLYEQRKSGEDEPLHIIPDSRQVDPAALKPGFCYMQITAVEPVVGEIEDRWLGRTLEPHVAGAPIFGCFYFDTPFTEAGKTHAGGLEDQWKRRTLLYTMMTFPSVMQRLEVTRSQVREYSPIENAVQVIDSRTHALQSELEAQGVDPAAESGGTELNLPRLQSLQRLLQGSVALQVNSGVLGVCIAFYKGVSEGAPQPKDERRFKPEVIQQLTTAILSFAAICKRGIAVHARASKDQEFHSQLVEGFECLVVEIGRYIPEIRS